MAIDNPQINDIEDGIQSYHAKDAGCDYLISENVSDSHFSETKTISWRDFLPHEAC